MQTDTIESSKSESEKICWNANGRERTGAHVEHAAAERVASGQRAHDALVEHSTNGGRGGAHVREHIAVLGAHPDTS